MTIASIKTSHSLDGHSNNRARADKKNAFYSRLSAFICGQKASVAVMEWLPRLSGNRNSRWDRVVAAGDLWRYVLTGALHPDS
jgi:hypothetical protein